MFKQIDSIMNDSMFLALFIVDASLQKMRDDEATLRPKIDMLLDENPELLEVFYEHRAELRRRLGWGEPRKVSLGG